MTDITDALDSIDTGDDEEVEDSRGPIGNFSEEFLNSLPPNPVVEQPGMPAQQGGYAPIYIDDDNWLLFANMSHEVTAGLQQQMVSAGFLDPANIREIGVWNDGEALAMRDIMTIANGTNRSYYDVLASQQGNAARRASSGGGSGRLPTIQLSNADDLKAAFRNAAKSATGGVFLDEAKLDSMVAAFHDQERTYQRKLARGGGETQAPPSAASFTETAIEEETPGAIQANRFQQMTQVLNQIVGA